MKIYKCYEGELYEINLSSGSFGNKQEVFKNELRLLNARISQTIADQTILRDKLAELLNQSAKFKVMIQKMK